MIWIEFKMILVSYAVSSGVRVSRMGQILKVVVGRLTAVAREDVLFESVSDP